jgi:Uma2 family endonuclease
MATEIFSEPLTTSASPKIFPAVPPLENGDHLTRAEFERRYDAMLHVKKAELIQGVVYMASPVRISVHGEQHAAVITWLGLFRAFTPGVRLGDHATLRIDEDNEPQPDAALFIDEKCGGRSYVSDDGYLTGAPELLVEIAASTASYDLREKLATYQNNGVQEYVVWSVYDRRIDWFRLENGNYARLDTDENGIIASRVFPGLRLNVNALLQGDLARVVSDLQQGLATPEHAAFIKHLADTTN